MKIILYITTPPIMEAFEQELKRLEFILIEIEICTHVKEYVAYLQLIHSGRVRTATAGDVIWKKRSGCKKCIDEMMHKKRCFTFNGRIFDINGTDISKTYLNPINMRPLDPDQPLFPND